MGSKKSQQQILKVIVLSQLLIEANDDIKNSDFYKGKLKVFGKQYINQLGSALKQTDAVYATNPTILTNVLNNIEELCQKISDMDVHDLVMINQIHEHYKDHKDDWDNFFEVEMQQLQN